MTAIHTYFENRFKNAAAPAGSQRRIGSELKFPLVETDGSAAAFEKTTALWKFLEECGWQPVVDAMTGRVTGASRPGPRNDTIASCETGYCKTEFSLAHVGDLFELSDEIEKLVCLLRRFSEQENVCFLGYGMQPLTPPGKNLLMKKGRAGVWDKVFSSNNHIRPEDGDDVHLFTVNAASHVHISVGPDEAVRAVNVLNGFSGAQIALTAHSSIWRGGHDTRYKCVAEKLWDWWMDGDRDRIGVPSRPFENLYEYIDTVAGFRPVFVTRDGMPIVLTGHRTFKDYFFDGSATGFDSNGCEVPLVPENEDFDLHCTCYWYNARISRYFTVENRVNDQQPPDDLITVPALTLGLVSAGQAAWEELSSHDWETLRQCRSEACCRGLAGSAGGVSIADLAARMLDLASIGLKQRGLGEERFLEPLHARLRSGTSPADEAERLYRDGGIALLVKKRKI